jgi:putative oxidoreductase
MKMQRGNSAGGLQMPDSRSAGPGEAATRGVILIRIAVGAIFLTQGILKFIDASMGASRFARIGFPYPWFTAHFVGSFEVVCGALVILGLLTRIAAAPLLIIICTAIATTKLPELVRPGQGLWTLVSDARTDFAMLCGLLFLMFAGGGRWSLDASFSPPEDAGDPPGA